MPWFRAKRSLSSYVSLFALALQLALSFGHVHLDELGLGNGAIAAAQKQAAALGIPFCEECLKAQMAGG